MNTIVCPNCKTTIDLNDRSVFGPRVTETRETLTSQSRQRRILTPAEVRAVKGEDGKMHLRGYAAVFNQLSVPLQTRKGKQFREKIAPGAFKRSIDAGDDIALQFAHDSKKVLARTSAGTLKVTEDDKGLAFDAILADTTTARDLVQDVNHGNIRGMSFGFDEPEDEWAAGDEMPERTLRSIPFSEISATPYPAYEGTSIDVRSIDQALAKLEKPGDVKGGKRATVEMQDDSLVWVCRCGISYLRDAFDSCQRVIDVASNASNLDERDQQAIDDYVSSLRDLLKKARAAKAVLDALGADEEDEDDPEIPPPTSDHAAREARDKQRRQIQRAAEMGLSTAPFRSEFPRAAK